MQHVATEQQHTAYGLDDCMWLAISSTAQMMQMCPTWRAIALVEWLVSRTGAYSFGAAEQPYWQPRMPSALDCHPWQPGQSCMLWQKYLLLR